MADLLNQKIKTSFDKNQDRVLVAGMYAHNPTTGKFDYANVDDNGDLKVNIHSTSGGGDMKARTDIADPATSTFVKCNADGTLELTAELSTAGLATSAIQTDGTQKAMCMGNDSGSQKQILVSSTGVLQTLDNEVFGKTAQIANQTTLSNTNEATLIAQGNRAGIGVGNTSADGTGTNTALLTDTDGHLQVDVLTSGTLTITGDAQIKAEDDTASARNVRCNNSGHIKSACIGVESDGTLRQIQTNSAGQLKTKLIAEDNTATRREVRCNTVGHLQTALLGNTAGDGSGTIKNVVTDSDGHLQVDVLTGGGGGTQFASGATLGGTPTGTLLIGSNSGTAKEVSVNSSGDLTVKADVTNTTLAITASALPLPTGGATSALQSTGNSTLSAIEGSFSTLSTEATALLAEAHLGNIDTATSSIQSNVATSANQGTANTSLASIDTKLTDGSQEVKCMGNFGGANVQLKVDANGVVETSGGGGGSSSNTYSNVAVSVLAPTGTDTEKITTSGNIELTNARNMTITLYSTELSTALADVTKVGLEYSYDGTTFFTNLSSAGTPSFQTTFDIANDQRLDPAGSGNPILIDGNTLFPDIDKGKFVRVSFLHTNSAGSNVEIIPIIILNGA